MGSPYISVSTIYSALDICWTMLCATSMGKYIRHWGVLQCCAPCSVSFVLSECISGETRVRKTFQWTITEQTTQLHNTPSLGSGKSVEYSDDGNGLITRVIWSGHLVHLSLYPAVRALYAVCVYDRVTYARIWNISQTHCAWHICNGILNWHFDSIYLSADTTHADPRTASSSLCRLNYKRIKWSEVTANNWQ